MRTPVLVTALVLLLSALAAAPCEAQTSALDMEARALFEAGRVAFVDERYEDALGYFQRAHELSNRPELLYNIATSLDRLDRDDEALVQYEAYLAAVPSSEHTEEVEFRLGLLRGRLARERAEAEAARASAGAGARSASSGASASSGPRTSSERRSTTASSTSTSTAPRESSFGPTEGRTIRVGDPVADTAPSGGGDVTSEAWFWILIGAVVVGAGVGITAGIVASQDPGETDFVTGPDGRVIMTLTGSF